MHEERVCMTTRAWQTTGERNDGEYGSNADVHANERVSAVLS